MTATPALAAAASAPLPPGMRRIMLTATTFVVSLMALIDATIVAVCLPQMQGSLDATPDTITWVLTMYTIGQAIGIAMTAGLAAAFGRRTVMLVSVIGFIVLSCACGLAGSLQTMVITRFLQGVFSAPLIPLAQAIVVDAYPPAERAKGLGIWAVGAILGPAIGPAVGGALTQNIHWRMSFFVNVPFGAIALLLCLANIRHTERRPMKLDWTGLGLAALFVVALQVFLDQGDILDWFDSKLLCVLFATACIAGAAFVVRGLLVANSILPLRLFKDRTFAVCTVGAILAAMNLLGMLTAYPILLEDLVGWQVDTAGYVIGTFGIAGLVAALVMPHVWPWIGLRGTVTVGASIMAAGMFMATRLNTNVGPVEAMIPGLFMMFGLQAAFIPIATLAFSNVAADHRTGAAATFNFFKTIGLSIGVTIVSTVIYRRTQHHWNELAADVRANAIGLAPYLDPGHGWTQRTAIQVADAVRTQSTMLAVIDAFLVMFAASVAIAAGVVLTKRQKTTVSTSDAEGAV